MIYFTHDELVPPEIAAKGADYCFGLFKPALLAGLDQLRADLGFSLFVNDWAVGGSRKYSGYRTRSCSIGAAGSLHKSGMAIDLHTRTDAQMAALRARIAKMGYIYGFTRMEDPKSTQSWCHVDMKQHAHGGVYIFKP